MISNHKLKLITVLSDDPYDPVRLYKCKNCGLEFIGIGGTEKAPKYIHKRKPINNPEWYL